MAQKILRYVGLGLETVFGTPVAAVVHLDPASSSLDSPGDQLLSYGGGLGRQMRKVAPGPYLSEGGVDFAADISTFDLFMNFVLGVRSTDSGGQTPVAAEPHATGGGETTLDITLANPQVVPGTVIIEVTASQVAHDDGFGKIVDDSASGVVGFINYASGRVQLTGLTESTQYDFDYTYGFFVHTLGAIDEVELPSATFRLGKDEYEHTFAGTVINQMTLSVSREWLTVSLDIKAGKDLKDTLTARSSLLLIKESPLAFHKVALSLGDQGGALSDISAVVNSFEMIIINNGDTERGLGLNSRFPNAAFIGELEVSGSMELRFEDTSHKEDFWGAATGPSDDGPVAKAMQLDLDSGNYGSAAFDLPRVLYQGVQNQPSGRDKMVQPITFTAYEDESTEKVINLIVNNLRDLI